MSSQALTKRQSESALMPPPPPPKRIKRPATVLDEDVYTNALSDIIARDYFPGLLEAQVKQDYLDALDSKNQEWIATSKRRLVDVLRTPGRARHRPGPSSGTTTTTTPQFSDTGRFGDTPTGWRGETPSSVGSATPSTVAPSAMPGDESAAPDVSRLGLLEFQAKYTSEDNESFNKVLDKQNAKRRERYAWMWSGNKIPTARQIAHHRRETKRIEAQGGTPSSSSDPTTQAVAIKTDLDARPAKPDAWKARPENPLMFAPQSIEDNHETIQQRADAASRAGPKHVVYQNTRLPDETHRAPPPPPSPSISAIKDAIAGRPRPTDSEPGYTGGETPRVNGYAFVDDEEPEPIHSSTDDYNLLGTTDPQDRTPNPFSIRENRHREALHHRMVDRVSRKKRAEKAARETKTPVNHTPRFASSPRLDLGLRGHHPPAGSVTPGKALTPAAQKLLHQVGGSTPRTPGFSATSSGSGLRNMWTPTPRRGR